MLDFIYLFMYLFHSFLNHILNQNLVFNQFTDGLQSPFMFPLKVDKKYC